MQNVSLWRKDYFELKAAGKQQIQKELSVFPHLPEAGIKLLCEKEMSICGGAPSYTKTTRGLLISGDGKEMSLFNKT